MEYENSSLDSEREKTPEEIEEEMARTRIAITHKVAALESQVRDTVTSATHTITGTVDTVKTLFQEGPARAEEAIRHAKAALSDSVKGLLNEDLVEPVRKHPWEAVGISVGVGLLAGWMLSGGRSTRSVAAPAYSDEPVRPFMPQPVTQFPAPAPAPEAPAQPGLFDDLIQLMGRKLREVAENAIETASQSVNTSIREHVPEIVSAATTVASERLAPEPTLHNRLNGSRMSSQG